MIALLESPYMIRISVSRYSIWPNSAPLPDIGVQDVSNLNVELSMSLKVKSDYAIGLPRLDSFISVNNKIWPN